MATLSLYRNAVEILQIEIDEKTIFTHKLMGEHRIVSEFYSNIILGIQVGDYIIHNGEIFTLNRLPDTKKIDSGTYQYKCEFEGDIYTLSKKLFISTDNLAEWAYVGTAADYVALIVNNLNEIDSGWTSGTIDSTDERTLVFSNESCRNALSRIAQAFSLEFAISSKAISLRAAIGSNTAYSFSYGRNNGLYEISRQQLSDQGILTKIYGFGGTQNIPSTYRSRAKRLVFEDRFLTKNTSLYGVIEGQFTDETIYPKRTGTLTGVNMEFDSDVYLPRPSYIEDSSIDFDINDSLIAGVIPKVVFKSGDLSGIEFEIWKYDHSTKRIYFNPYSDEDGYTSPNPTHLAAIGDTYTLIGIGLPQAYIDDAEEALQTATQAYLDKMSVPQVVYSAVFDPRYIKSNSISLIVGDKVTIVDSELGVNAMIRISALSYPLVEVERVTVTIADFVPYTVQERIYKTTITNKAEILVGDVVYNEMNRRTALLQKQLKELLFDPDGYFDPVNLKPLSIETMYLSVGTSSMNFRLNGVAVKPNYENDANAFYASAGTLIHNAIHNGTDTPANYIWTISPALDVDLLTPASAYYLYVKASKSDQTATWDLSTDKKASDGVGYYYFMCGVLYAVMDGVRDYDFSYGMTYINGRTITTGKIQSADTLNYLDLENNQFMIGDGTYSLDWNVTEAGVLTIHGANFTGAMTGVVISPGTVLANSIVTWDGTSGVYVNHSVNASIDEDGTLTVGGDVIAYQLDPPAGSFWDSIPVRYSIEYTSSFVQLKNDVSAPGANMVYGTDGSGVRGWIAGGTIGVTDHGALTGLSDDDHSIYHTDARAATWLATTDVMRKDPLLTQTNHYTGFPNRTDTTISFVPGASGVTRTLTISGTNWKFYIDGVEYTVASSLSKQIPDTTGFYWFWITAPGGVPQLNGDVSGQTFGSCLVATVYWNTTIDKGIVGDERHWMGRDKWLHEYLHETIRARWSAGGTITPTDTTFSITQCEIYDEDIEHILSAATTCSILYKNGSANWEWDSAQTNLYKLNGSQMRYNNGNNLADCSTNDYVAMWVYATNFTTDPFTVIIGQRVDTTIANARANNTPDSLVLGSLPAAEIKLLYRVIFRQLVSSVSYIESADYRTISYIPSGTYSATDHSILSKLDYASSGHTGFAPLASPTFTGLITTGTDGIKFPATAGYYKVRGSQAGGAISFGVNGGTWDRNLYLGFVDNSDNFSSVMSLIHETGAVGIGIASPLYTAANRTTLNINGTSTAILGLSIGGSGAGYLYHSGTDIYLVNELSGAMRLSTSNVERITILAGGSVGIWNTNPVAAIHLKDASQAINSGFNVYGNLFVSTTDAYAADKGATIALGGVYHSNGSIAAYGKISARKANATDGNVDAYMSFEIGDDGTAPYCIERVRINKSGDVKSKGDIIAYVSSF